MNDQMESTRDAYGQVLVELGNSNKNIVVLDADVSKATRTNKFAEEFPERFFNCGCAEQNKLGVAAGLSLTGKVPFVSTFAVFATCRVLDQVRNSICYPKLNVKIMATHGGITVGADGPSHQSIEDISLMRVLPNMTVIVPADSGEAKKAIRKAARYPGPVYVRLGRPKVPLVVPEDFPFQIGKSSLLREGDDVTIIACGIMVGAALEAAEKLAQRQIFAKVINMHTIKPLDEKAIIAAAKETKAIVTAEEHTIRGGLGGAVAEVLGEKIPVPLRQIGIKDTFAESGEPPELLKKYALTPAAIFKAAGEVIAGK